MAILFKVWREFTLVLIVLTLAGCGSSKKVNPVLDDNPSPVSAGMLDESFDPLSLGDEDVRFPEGGTVSAGEMSSAGDTPPPANTSRRMVDGFRIQLFAAKDIERVTVEKKEAEFLFLQDGVGVYIEFDSPMYKLRIGDCVDREAANQLRELAKSRGYASAWIVKTKVSSTRRSGGR